MASIQVILHSTTLTSWYIDQGYIQRMVSLPPSKHNVGPPSVKVYHYVGFLCAQTLCYTPWQNVYYQAFQVCICDGCSLFGIQRRPMFLERSYLSPTHFIAIFSPLLVLKHWFPKTFYKYENNRFGNLACPSCRQRASKHGQSDISITKWVQVLVFCKWAACINIQLNMIWDHSKRYLMCISLSRPNPNQKYLITC